MKFYGIKQTNKVATVVATNQNLQTKKGGMEMKSIGVQPQSWTRK